MNGNIGNMGDMGSMIAKMLEDPEALGKVMSLAGTLSSSGLLSGLGMGDNAQESVAAEQKSFQETSNTASDSSKYEVKKAPPSQTVGNLPKSHENHGHSYRKIKSSDRIRLLEAMRPFLSDDKRDKLDVVIKIIGLADAAGGLYSKR